MEQENQELQETLRVAYFYLSNPGFILISTNLSELKEKVEQLEEDSKVEKILNYLKIANKKIEDVEKEYPDLKATIDSYSQPIEIDAYTLKGISFYLEGLCRLVFNENKEAIKLFHQSLDWISQSKLKSTFSTQIFLYYVYCMLSEVYHSMENQAKSKEMREKAEEVYTVDIKNKNFLITLGYSESFIDYVENEIAKVNPSNHSGDSMEVTVNWNDEEYILTLEPDGTIQSIGQESMEGENQLLEEEIDRKLEKDLDDKKAVIFGGNWIVLLILEVLALAIGVFSIATGSIAGVIVAVLSLIFFNECRKTKVKIDNTCYCS